MSRLKKDLNANPSVLQTTMKRDVLGKRAMLILTAFTFLTL